jgi:hypothetical protein
MATKQEKSFENEWIIYSNPVQIAILPTRESEDARNGWFTLHIRWVSVNEAFELLFSDL